jgi:hypothetical protein
VRVHVEHQHAARAGVEGGVRRQRQAVEGAKAGAVRAPAWCSPLASAPAQPLRSAARAAATAPPLEARTIVHSCGSQEKPCDSASARGSPVRTAAT